jgi:hypothetical protein
MTIILDEFSDVDLIGKYVKCFEYIEPDYGQVCYTSDEPISEEYQVRYKFVTNVVKYKTRYGSRYCVYFETKYSDLDLFEGEEIEIFDTNPVTT